jgi:RNA polymerase sigma-70 factor (ECF subfamily)
MRLDGRGDMDTELVRRAQGGDREAFAALVPPAVERLLGVAFRILGDADLADEATQVAVIAAWRKLPSLREPERFEAWLYRLVVNACRDEARRRPWEVRAPVPLSLAVDAADPEGQVDDRDRLERAFRELSIDHRAVIVLHHYVGLSLVEVARVIGIPTGTTRSRLHYALRAMRAALEADDSSPKTRVTA